MMEVTHHLVSKVARIYEAMNSLVYRVRINKKFILGLAERWCIETISFVFLWDESTVTLEDMIILGGLLFWVTLICPSFNLLSW